ncbi:MULTISPECIES: competence type IV pilus major pilin ComGC [unclassified Streptococcus]|uniref:competence type IV pilus major pilin ComGC n=1 Tax=unclassified Streptococcus TaxID=2608887 RepID=UPI001072BBDE|nr:MULTISPECIES: competence type IV pilus major pilin ComGC [unclassified Streptococcus]MBF0786736.1 prepilin-type N-terminal cleavage/methylation domain-containing protein [Streptococcus sp. 19428wC2_LYSM12]MCQ9211608.1 prepilin-type N-terminal cleavage/methylation domain-containing protein [Streptococcus sp. B01]MCQ9213200.1 prepilin-type N-terminal cleavage/methylation domain-containing protein [Streptococcus sp. O1]MCQ9214921.1 prepilin-type N-terminal cleavage/methylation domain-containing
MKKLKKLTVRGFTLIEMLVVLFIISILLLLFIPNISKQKETVKQAGNAAVVKVVEGQAELYELQNGREASLSKLVEAGAVTEAQAEAYNEYYAKNTDKSRTVNP